MIQNILDEFGYTMRIDQVINLIKRQPVEAGGKITNVAKKPMDEVKTPEEVLTPDEVKTPEEIVETPTETPTEVPTEEKTE